MSLRRPRHGHSWHVSYVWFLIFSLGLVAAGFIVGYLYPHHFSSILQPALKKIQDLDAQVQGEALWHLALAIFLNNVFVAITLIVFGIIFGIYPAWTMWMNGVVMGVVSSLVVAKTGASVGGVIIWALLPHGLFEMTALIWSSALGCQLGFALIGSIAQRIGTGKPQQALRSGMSFRSEAVRAARHLPVIVLLLIVAACIETYATPHIIAAHLSM